MKTYNQKSRPSVLLIGFDDEYLIESQLLETLPTSRHIYSMNEISEVHQAEYDVVIAYEQADLTQLAVHLQVIVLGGDKVGEQPRKEEYPVVLFSRESASAATIFSSGPTVEEGSDLQRLVDTTLVPVLNNERKHAVLEGVQSTYMSGGFAEEVIDVWTPIIMDSNLGVLAGYIPRTEQWNAPELWCLPVGLEPFALKRWTKFLFSRWSRLEPTAFPSSNPWRSEPAWLSTEELAIEVRTNNENDAYARLVKTHEARLAKLTNEKMKASAEADANLRVLLTAQGDSLKDAVNRTLASFGFDMVDVDADPNTDKGDKLEDLRARTQLDKTSNVWEALVEVKGYSKSPKLNDLLKLGRFTSRYQQANSGQMPGGVWYVVNHDIDLSPSRRKQAMQAHAKEIEEFARIGGLVIDTVQLFKLVQARDAEVVTNQEARDMLTQNTGYFTQ